MRILLFCGIFFGVNDSAGEFAVESGDMKKAIMWVLIITFISIIMILILNRWSENQQRTIGKTNRREYR